MSLQAAGSDSQSGLAEGQPSPLPSSLSTPACLQAGSSGLNEPADRGAPAAVRAAAESGHNGAGQTGVSPHVSAVGVAHPAPHSGGWQYSGAVMPAPWGFPYPPSPWFYPGSVGFAQGAYGALPPYGFPPDLGQGWGLPSRRVGHSKAASTAPSSASGVVAPDNPGPAASVLSAQGVGDGGFLPPSDYPGGVGCHSASDRHSTLSDDEGEASLVSESEPPSFLFAEALEYLGTLCPSALTPHESPAPRMQSAAEEALGYPARPVEASSLLRESRLVSQASEAAHAIIRRGASAPPPGTLPEAQGASLRLGTFVPQGRRFFRRQLLGFASLPPSCILASRDDASMLLDRAKAPSVTLSDRSVAEFEESSRRGLEATSVLDSFLGGLAVALRGLASTDNGGASTELDGPAILSMVGAMSEALNFLLPPWLCSTLT